MSASHAAVRFLHWTRQYSRRPWIWIVLILAGAGLLLRAFLPVFLHREITASLAAATTAEVHLANVRLNLFRGRIGLEELALTLQGEKQPVITVRELGLNFSLVDLLYGRITLEDISLSGLGVAAAQDADGQLNLSRLFPPEPQPKTPTPDTKLPTLMVECVTFDDGRIAYQDTSRSPSARFVLAIHNLITGPIDLQPQGLVGPVAIRLNGTFNESPLRGEAQVSWQQTAMTVEAKLDAQRLPLVMVVPYVQSFLTLQQLSGLIDARLQYRYHSGEGKPAVNTLDGSLKLEQVRFADPLSGQVAFDLPSGDVAVEKIDFLKQEIRIKTLSLLNAKLLVLQTQTGINWAAVAQPGKPSLQGESSSPTTESSWRFSLQEARLTGGELTYRDSTWIETESIVLIPEEIVVQAIGNEMKDSSVRFQVRLGEGSFRGEGKLQLAPFSFHNQVELSNIDVALLRPLLVRALAAESVGGNLNGTVHIAFDTQEERQTVRVNGAVETTTFSLAGVPESGSSVSWEHGRVELQDGSTVVPFAVGLNTQLAKMLLQHSDLGPLSIGQVSGNLRLTAAEKGESHSASEQTGNNTSEPGESLPDQAVSLLAQGTVEFTDVVLKDSEKQEILLALYKGRGTLREGSRLLPLDLRLQDLALEYPYILFRRTPTGQFQIFSPVTSESEPLPVAETVPAQPAEALDNNTLIHAPLTVQIDRATVNGGELFFVDQIFAPPQTVFWQNVELDLHNFQYPHPLAATFTIRAFNEDGAPVQFQGTVEPQAQQTVVRVRGEIERMSLPRFNRYLAPLGYPIRHGAVSLRFDVVIPGDRLQANSDITLHDLGLGNAGRTSELEKQVGLPLSLVIALLKDLNGNIYLQLPITGRLDQPGFQLSGTIWRAIRDALIGAITSPLKLLGAVFAKKGTIQNFTLDPITFVPGTSQLSAQGEKQIARLGSFLSQRPELDLRLSGYTNANDREALQDQLILAQLQAPPPAAETQAPSIPDQQGTTSQLTPQDEIRQFLTDRLGKLNGSDSASVLSEQATALLSQLRTQTVVPSQDLDRLAQERVQAVITDLTATRAIPASRLLLTQVKLPGREGAEVRYMIQAREDDSRTVPAR